jgi:hypothetical protein
MAMESGLAAVGGSELVMALPPGMILAMIAQPLLFTGLYPFRKTCNQLRVN